MSDKIERFVHRSKKIFKTVLDQKKQQNLYKLTKKKIIFWRSKIKISKKKCGHSAPKGGGEQGLSGCAIKKNNFFAATLMKDGWESSRPFVNHLGLSASPSPQIPGGTEPPGPAYHGRIQGRGGGKRKHSLPP